jgi:hypothetical protein
MFSYHEVVLDAHVATGSFRRDHATQQAARLELARIRYQLANLLFEAGRHGESLRYYLKGLRTHASARNARLFAFHASRKLGRVLSLGKLRAEKLA